MKKIIFATLAVLIFAALAHTQVPTATLIKIAKAEDARAYDASLEALMRSPSPAIRTRAALAAGRIGNDAAVPVLIDLLEKDTSVDVKAMAAFALGEIESVKAADAILKALKRPDADKAETRPVGSVPRLTARLAEAAGKIAAANPKDERCKALSEAILDALDTENRLGAKQDRDIVILGLTAALRTGAINPRRARPDDTDFITAEFLKNPDARIRADAANTLARLRSKNADALLRAMLTTDTDAVARASAARALGAAEDRTAIGLLTKALTSDTDLRVRVSAIRALAGLRDQKVAEKLIERGDLLLALQRKTQKSKTTETSELLEIATALGRLLPNTENTRAVVFLNEFRLNDSFSSPETEIALASVSPKAYVAARLPDDFGYGYPEVASAYGQGMTVIAASVDEELRMNAAEKLRSYVAGMASGVKPGDQVKMLRAMPDLTKALAAFKPDNLDEIIRGQLESEDIFIRAAAAELLSKRALSKENIEALEAALYKSLQTDTQYNDAQLAILDAIGKYEPLYITRAWFAIQNFSDYLVRKKAADILNSKGYTTDTKNHPISEHILPIRAYNKGSKSKLGVVLNTDVDYRRALSRKNGTVKAVLTTEKGTFTIDFYPEEAPLTVDNFVKLARSGYFNGLEVHRVVPNFVMQDGDPRGDGNGGPGWSIRCEVNMREYDRGAVGMALSGKDTGGSQWFVTHSPQPHLDGGYTVFGHVNETGMKVVDSIVRGDKILTVKIIGR